MYTPNKAEIRFETLATKLGFKVSKASFTQDVYKHWDYQLSEGQYPHLIGTYDVKALKRIQRHDTNTQSDYLWVEVKGVKDGGWLFGGKADFIAFETPTGFLIIPREALINKVVELVDFDKIVYKPSDALYALYQRKNRQDWISLIQKSDILDIVTSVWEF